MPLCHRKLPGHWCPHFCRWPYVLCLVIRMDGPTWRRKISELMWSAHLYRWPSCLLMDPNFPQQQTKINWRLHTITPTCPLPLSSVVQHCLFARKIWNVLFRCCTTRTPELHKTSNQAIQCQRICRTPLGAHIVESCMGQFRRNEVFTH
jgi:hypothetical protein